MELAIAVALGVVASFLFTFALCGLLSGAETYREGWDVMVGKKNATAAQDRRMRERVEARKWAEAAMREAEYREYGLDGKDGWNNVGRNGASQLERMR
jgi:hypothetical protein